jgi:hypothetical protein
MTSAPPEIQLSFEPLALERCFVAADVLHDAFGESQMEYALLGLSTEQDPFRVVETPLLPGQHVTTSTVVQSGRQVLRMRGEIDRLSRRMRQPLRPIAFIHRHPGSCHPSRTDVAFLRGVFVDQVFTASSFEDVRLVGARDGCSCPRMRALQEALAGTGARFRSPCGVAFSLIVNRERDHSLFAVCKRMCPACGRAEVLDAPVRLAVDPQPRASSFGRQALRRSLEAEIRAKIHFDREADAAGATR